MSGLGPRRALMPPPPQYLSLVNRCDRRLMHLAASESTIGTMTDAIGLKRRLTTVRAAMCTDTSRLMGSRRGGNVGDAAPCGPYRA